MSTFHILSLDGGGIRGVLSCILLQRLEEACPGFMQKIDLFAGTSTGGVLALAFAAGKTPAEARRLYETKGNAVFANWFLDDLRDIGNAIGAQYTNTLLKEELEKEFGNTRLAELSRRVLITSFDLDNDASDSQYRTWKPKFFHNFPGPEMDGDQKVVDVALRTGAAPTYFPIYQGYIDGGVVANNPSMCALAQALDGNTGRQKLENIALLSVSTGSYARYLNVQSGDWGWMQWARPMIEILLEGSSKVAHYQCARLLDKQYFRLDPHLPHPISLDSVSSIPELIEIARGYELQDAITWLKNQFLP